jgi:hypothetical protein
MVETGGVRAYTPGRGNFEATNRGERAKASPEPSTQVGKFLFRVIGVALYVVHNTVGS